MACCCSDAHTAQQSAMDPTGYDVDLHMGHGKGKVDRGVGVGAEIGVERGEQLLP